MKVSPAIKSNGKKKGGITKRGMNGVNRRAL